MLSSIRPVLVALVATVGAGLTACTPVGQGAAQQVAQEFQAAIGDGDTTTACGLLSDETRSSLEGATTRSCAEALAALRLPAGPVRSVQVWGRDAQVVLDPGVLFLAQFRAGWRVTAAGCTPRPDQPYDCPVKA